MNGMDDNVDQVALDLGFEVVGYNDIPSPFRQRKSCDVWLEPFLRETVMVQ